MRLIPSLESIQIKFENPLEKSVLERWLKCVGEVGPILDRGASGHVLRGIYINFVPKENELLPSPPMGPAEVGFAEFRG